MFNNFTTELRPDNISEIALEIIKIDAGCRIFLFHGEMGSGKTTLIKEICRVLGSTDDLSSPTFSIVNEYSCPEGKIFHFDLYRVQSMDELLDIGFDDYVYSGNYCFIEWPALAEKYLQEKCISVNINIIQQTRIVSAAKLN